MTNHSPNQDGHFSGAYSLKTGAETRAHYRDWAASYDQEIGEQNKYAQPRRVADKLQHYQPDTDIGILDVGCGSGLSGVELANRGYTTIDGCDFSPEMLSQAEKKNVYRRLTEVDLNKGQPELAEAAYDAITAVGVFSFGHIDPDACDDLVRLLVPGGLLIIALNEHFWNQGDLTQKLDHLQEQGSIVIHEREFGEHLPGHEVKGWVIVCQKAQ